MTRRRAVLGQENGAAALEFALILPLLVMLVMGIVEFSRAYNTKEALQYAVREGARELALHGSANVVAVVQDRAKPLGTRAGEPAVSVTIVASCPAGAPATSPGRVTASYPWTYNIPLWGTNTKTLSATGAMRCNG